MLSTAVCEEERCILHSIGFMCEIGSWGKSHLLKGTDQKGKVKGNLSTLKIQVPDSQKR